MKTKFIILLFIFSLNFSCSKKSSKNPTLRESTGGINEIILVGDNYFLDSTELGNSLYNSLNISYPIISQDENFFKLINIDHENFSDLYKTRRNIIIYTDIYDEIKNEKSNGVYIKKDVWASPQNIFFINFTHKDTLLNIIKNQIPNILKEIINSEMDYLSLSHKKRENLEIKNIISNKFNIDLIIPSEFSIVTNDDANNFLWVWYETISRMEEKKVSIFINEIKYEDTSQFSSKNIKELRNEISKKYIKGTRENSYMIIENIIDPTIEIYNFKNQYSKIMRGLWKMENDFMGGNFISYVILNPNRKTFIFIDGFVYAPNQDLSFDLFNLETIINSITFKK